MKMRIVRRVAVVAALIIVLSESAVGIVYDLAIAVIDIILEWLAREIVGARIADFVRDMSKNFYNNFLDLMIATPPVAHQGITNLSLFFIHIIVPLYVIATIIVGILLLFASISPKARAMLKSAIPLLVAGMVLVSLSNLIFQETLYVSSHITLGIMNQQVQPVNSDVLKDTFDPVVQHFLDEYNSRKGSSIDLALIYAYLPLVLVSAPLAVMCLRYILVLLFAALFPLSIFLYTFSPTKKIGRLMLEETIIWVFVPFLEVIILLVSIIVIGWAKDSTFVIFVKIAALMMLTLTPIIVAGTKGFMPK